MKAGELKTELKAGELYPVAPGEPVPIGHTRETLRVQATGEFRPPRKGEWYLSGAIVEGYRAVANTSTPFPIGQLLKGELVWRETRR